MPPKKAKRGASKGRGGGKGGKNKGKKNLKKLKKFSNLMYENEYIWEKSRGELEVIAMTLQDQVDVERAEKYIMSYERDWFFEMTRIYLTRIRNIRKKEDLTFAEVQHLHADEEELKLYARLQRKHYLYETCIRNSSMAFRDQKLLNRYAKLAPETWKYAYLDVLDCDEELDGWPKLRAQRKAKKREALIEYENKSLDGVHERWKRIYHVFEKCVNHICDEMVHCTWAEYIDAFDYNGRFMALYSSRVDFGLSILKSYSIDNIHNILTVIVSMLDHWDDMDLDTHWRIAHTKLYRAGRIYMEDKHEKLENPYRLKRVRGIEYGRALEGLETTYKSIRVTEFYLAVETARYIQTIKDWNEFFVQKPAAVFPEDEVEQELYFDYAADLHELKQFELEVKYACDDHYVAKVRFRNVFGREAEREYWLWRPYVDAFRKYENGRYYQLFRAMRIHDDFYVDVRDRLDTLGVKERCYPIRFRYEEFEELAPVWLYGYDHGLILAPHNCIVNQRGFPVRPRTQLAKMKKQLCDDQEENTFNKKSMYDVLYSYGAYEDSVYSYAEYSYS